MNSICFFNNKGGVGKTTLVCNVASYLATTRQQRVLLVDADPQCNSTQLILDEAVIDDLYRESKVPTKGRPRSRSAVTLFDILQPIAAGEPDINTSIKPKARSQNRFGVDLIPGHPHMSVLEDKLSQSWLSFGGGDLGGARITNWNTQLCQAISDYYDLVFFDVGPSLGALNRSVLLGAEYFVTPMGCDIFSIMGITNIAGWLEKWTDAYDNAILKVQESWETEDYSITTDTASICRFVGYTVQQYITKSKEGKRRPTKAFERILEAIPSTIDDSLSGFTAPHLSVDQLRLPDVPHMFSLVPLAQNRNVPIHLMESADGLVGTQYSQKEDYVKFIEGLSDAILLNVGSGLVRE